MKAVARSLRITSKKINLIANLVRRKNAVEALNILKFTPKKGAKLLYKVVRSAIANAENNFKQERPSLFIKEIVVTEAATMKRSVPISRGRTNPILKRNAHVWVMLGVLDDETGMEMKKESDVDEVASKGKKVAKKTTAKKSEKSAPKAVASKESVKVTTKKESVSKKKSAKV